MKRKVVQIAGFTKVVSLPSKWVKSHNVQKGDELNIDERGDFLLVSTAPAEKKIKRAHIDASRLDEHVVWPILALVHKTGYDEIKIVGVNKSVMKVVHERVASSLFGFEVIEQTSDYCIIKNLAEGMSTNLQSILRKIFIVTLSQARQGLECVKAGDEEILQEILKLEETNNKLTNYSQRMLNDDAMSIQNRYDYFIVWLLENVGDGYRDLCKAVYNNKNEKVSQPVLEVYEKVTEIFEMYYELFYKFNLEGLSKFIRRLKDVRREVRETLPKKKGLDVVVLAYLFNIISAFYDFVGATVYLKADLDVKIK